MERLKTWVSVSCLFIYGLDHLYLLILTDQVGRSSRHLDYQALLIPAIDDLTNLKCLFLQQNCISIMENMDCLTDLDTLNLSNNLIKSIQGLSNLSKITTLTISHNFLQSADDIREMLNCPSLW